MWSKSGAIVASKEARENAMKTRKKNIMCLINDYLREEGYFKSADTLINEASLGDDYKLCDNVNLDIILQEYTNYFQLKYNKAPNICKKVENDTKDDTPRSKSVVRRQNSKLSCQQKQTEAPIEENNHNLSDNIKITKILEQNTRMDYTFSEVNKPISDFLVKVPEEFKCIIESIYSECKMQPDKVTWSEIKGLDYAVQLLKEATTQALQYPHLFKGLASPWRSILFYGPPGTGKTMLAKALAFESQLMLFNVTPSVILSKWRGESEKVLKLLFNLARYYAPSVIFIDEVEALASRRDSSNEHEASRRLKSELLIEMDGLRKCNENVLFLTTSNLPWEIDEAILRRMEKRIYIPLPDRESRHEMFTSKIDGVNSTIIDFERLAEITDGYSGSDIQIVCREAAMASVRALLAKSNAPAQTTTTTTITQDDLEAAVSKIKPSVGRHADRFRGWSAANGAE